MISYACSPVALLKVGDSEKKFAVTKSCPQTLINKEELKCEMENAELITRHYQT